MCRWLWGRLTRHKGLYLKSVPVSAAASNRAASSPDETGRIDDTNGNIPGNDTHAERIQQTKRPIGVSKPKASPGKRRNGKGEGKSQAESALSSAAIDPSRLAHQDITNIPERHNVSPSGGNAEPPAFFLEGSQGNDGSTSALNDTPEDLESSKHPPRNQQSQETRLFARPAQVLETIVGPNAEPGDLQPLQWQLLSVIASREEQGILQTDLITATGQDKRSVPGRVKGLVARGYVDRVFVLANTHRTCVLTLKKFLRKASILSPDGVFRYELFLVGAMAMCKEKGTISLEEFKLNFVSFLLLLHSG